MAIEEAVYALEELQAEGVGVESNHHGLYHGDPKLDPFYAELNRRKAAMFIHPTAPSCDGCTSLSLGYPGPLLEFMFETTRTVTHLILCGVTVRYPDIRIIVPRAGAALSVFASRVDGFSPLLARGDSKAIPKLRTEMRNLYFDLAGAPLPELLEALLKIADPDRLFYGSDWPFTPLAAVKNAAAALQATPLLDNLEAVMNGNARKLFPGLQSANLS